MQTLIATWLNTQVPGFDCPHSVFWEDGSEAAEKDHYAHRRDTCISVAIKSGGRHWHLFPDVVAEAYYCPHGRVWGVRGDGIEPESLGITDPLATDDEINNAISALPIEYRVKITR
jgi:hypothetical protein